MKKVKDTNRIAKVNSKIEHELGEILHEFFMGENALITITRVDTTKDMKWAKVWISILAAKQHPTHPNQITKLAAEQNQTAPNKKAPLSLDDKILDQINKNIYDIQGELNRKFSTKIVPRLQFVLDLTPRHAQHIDELIKKIHSEE